GAGAAERGGHVFGGGVGVLEPGHAGGRVGATGVQHHRPQVPTPEYLPAPLHRGGRHPVAGEEPGRGRARAVVDDQGDIAGTVALEAGGHAGGPEPGRRGHPWVHRAGHGATPSAVKPAVSASPSIRLAHCTAWPAAPLTRLSRALTTMIRPESASMVACSRQELAPRVAPVWGQAPSGSSRTNGSSWYASASTRRTAAGLTSGPAGRVVTVARMPRGIGASTGVNDRLRAPGTCLISGTCWWAPTW